MADETTPTADEQPQPGTESPATEAEATETESAAATASATATTTLAEEAAEALAPQVAPGPRDLPSGEHWFWGTGRRKSSVARARVRPGEAGVDVNGREVDKFFTEMQHRQAVQAPLEVTKTTSGLEVHVNVRGGGITGQAEACRLAVARALKDYDPSLEEALRDRGYLTVDARKVERKKYGQPGARRRFQFSKR